MTAPARLYNAGPAMLFPTRRLLSPVPTLHAALLHASPAVEALSKFAMPAMSPTMTEGGIATWKKKEGDSFSPGDVLVEIVRVLS